MLDANANLLARLEPARREAGRRMGLGDVSAMVVPKVGLLSAPRNGGTIPRAIRAGTSSPQPRRHRRVVSRRGEPLHGSIAHDLAQSEPASPVTIEHPSGRIQVDLSFGPTGDVEAPA